MTPTAAPGKTTVLIVDDSSFMRHALARDLGRDPELEVVGAAADGVEALVMIEKLNPQVVTLDIEMPRMDGLTTLLSIMARFPRPVIMLSSLTQEGSAATLKSLELGAVDFVGKPSGSVSMDFHKVREELVIKIKNVARNVNVSALVAGANGARVRSATGQPPQIAPSINWKAAKLSGVVVVGCSTGGPRALAHVVPGLPAGLPLPVLVVQHMPAGFTRSLAARLDSASQLVVREAVDGDLLQPGLALVAPGGQHMEVDSRRRIQLNENPSVNGVRPSVDVTLNSVARLFGKQTVVAILTGMGSDGAAGAKAIHALGGRVIAEHESTCVVYGMPRSVIEAGAADAVVALDDVPAEILNQIGQLVN